MVFEMEMAGLLRRWRDLRWQLLALSLSATAVPALAADDAYPHATETIGTVEQVYDGTLLPDAAVSTQ